ncbi:MULTISPECIES: hypothetical protein [Segatella]|jgi:hypothetical protein|uniref:Uncharacterized protein n=1 Tax=Segatella bryantii TaxID=77095 RepID=A0AA37HW39_SEGBR|nr:MULTISPECIES: hypothetical protein [Segatella]MEE3415135.1 hypothetical protein [Prevotella sp.]UKK78136.1 hypothetical protein L6469_10360 [Segatella baroniae B14]GJG27571.1 hypothetical protein PRRU23_12710 [Segatella bryantii]
MSSPSPFDEGKKRNNVDQEIAALVTSDASVLFSVLVDDHPMFINCIILMSHDEWIFTSEALVNSNPE